MQGTDHWDQSGIMSTTYLDLVSSKASSNWSAFSLKMAAAREPLFRTKSVTVQPRSMTSQTKNAALTPKIRVDNLWVIFRFY